MDENTYKTWWPLHLRVARGEKLTAEERATYNAGLKQLHQEEVIPGDLTALRQAKVQVAALEAGNARLQAQRQALDAEIAALEARLDDRTRQLLNAKD